MLPLPSSLSHNDLAVFCSVGFGSSALTIASRGPIVGRTFHDLRLTDLCFHDAGNETDNASQRQ
jgi:hypothetical protein